jgi:hypothetical protein
MTERSELDRLCQKYSDAYDQAEREHAERVERYRRHIRVIDDALRFVAGMAVVICAAWAITRIFTP